MTPLILINVFLAVSLAAFGLGVLLLRRDPAFRRRVQQLLVEPSTASAGGQRVRSRVASAAVRKLLVRMGQKAPASAKDVGELRLKLMQAGYRDAGASYVYLGLRIALGVVLPIVLLLTVVPAMNPAKAMMTLAAAAALGYILPSFALGRLVRRRKTRITDALPDTLDLMVVCVEAGLGLNQALMRVAEEMVSVERVISDEFNLVNLEMRAGTPRTEALKNLARRTGVEDVSSLVSMLVQTDRFGTSIARSLRVFSDSMRTRRRQKAEEAAAKTTIKMVFPLALCILPALLVVVLGPAALHIYDVLIKGQ
jgi:tight adherence protein C